MNREFEHILTKITEKEKRKPKEIVLNEVNDLHDSFSTVEYYPISRLIVLFNYLSDLAIDHPLSRHDKLFEDNDKSSTSGKIHTQLKVLEKILNLPEEVPCVVDRDTLIILNAYGYRSNHCKGRLYGQRNTMTLISRQCRYYLFKDQYFDVDLKNAHPSMLLFYAKSNGIEAPTLEEYVSNREEFLAKIVQESKLTRDKAKTEVLRAINLLTDKYLAEQLHPLFKEILPIRGHLFNSNFRHTKTALGEYCLTRESFKKKNPNQLAVSLQSHFCTSEESKCLEVLREVCLQKGLLDRDAKLSKDSRNLSFIPFFDGAYISFASLKRVKEVEEIIADTNELIAPYRFEVKEIKPEWGYINEQDLKYYEKIHDFMSKLSASNIEKLLQFLEIPPFKLDEEKLDLIIRRAESAENDDISQILNKDQNIGLAALQEGKNSDFNQLITEASKAFHYKFRRAMLQVYRENRIREVEDILKSKPKLTNNGEVYKDNPVHGEPTDVE